MKKISLLLIKSYIGPFIISFMIWLFIFELQFVWKYIDDMLGKGLSFGILAELFIYASAPLVNFALPIAILLSSIMTLGNLSEHFELTAMKSSGMSLFKILRPLIIFVFSLSVGAFIFSNNVMPVATLKFKTLLFSVTKKAPTMNIKPNVFYNDIDGVVIRAEKNNIETGELTNMMIYDHTEHAGNLSVIKAEKGFMNQNEGSPYMILELYNGVSYSTPAENGVASKNKKHPAVVNSFEKNEMRFDISSLLFKEQDEDLFAHREEMMTISQLTTGIDSLKIKVLESYLTRKEQGYKTFKLTADSTLYTVDTVRVDSVFFYDQLSIQQKERGLEKALNSAKKHKELQERTMKQLDGKIHRINSHKIEWHRKFVLAFSCIVLFFIGAPLGAITRKGGIGFPTLLALGFFILYYALSIMGEKMVKTSALEPWIGMWLSTIVLAPVALFLTYTAMKDSSFTDADFYKKLFSRLFVPSKYKSLVEDEDSSALS